MKKTLSFLAALVMGCTAAPMTVFAEDDVYSGYEMGDVDLDGDVDAADAHIIRYLDDRHSNDWEEFLNTIEENEDESWEFGKFTNERKAAILALGDVNGDGIIDKVDADCILEQYTDFDEYEVGDVSRDGVIDATDCADVLVYYAVWMTSPALEFTNPRFTDEVIASIEYLGDVSGDDCIDAMDAAEILRLYVDEQTQKAGIEAWDYTSIPKA